MGGRFESSSNRIWEVRRGRGALLKREGEGKGRKLLRGWINLAWRRNL